jgi:preprotein translocase subunit SecF
MKKNPFIFLAIVSCFCFSNNSFGQGIKFEEGNWASVKEKAKKENKLYECPLAYLNKNKYICRLIQRHESA